MTADMRDPQSVLMLEARARAAGFVFVFASALPRVASATTYYVANSGNDDSTGTSESAPYKTIRKAISMAQPGDVVLIDGGVYAGWENQIDPVRSGTAEAYITFRAKDGALPIIEPPPNIDGGSGFEPLERAVKYIRVEGIAARNWPSSGFSNGWAHPSSHIEIRYCIADGNGINGIAFYAASDFSIEHNIVAHNGNRVPSWSSGVNVFAVQGSYLVNVVRGNVSFENVDICGDPSHGCDPARSTDGNGYILDERSQGALFENNIGFRNGGSCIRVTKSSNAHLVNNSCHHDGQDSGYDFVPAEIHFADDTSRSDVLVLNNVAAALGGRLAVNFEQGLGSSSFSNNVWVDAGGSAAFFSDPEGSSPDFRPSSNASALVDKGGGSALFASDVGFDPRCLKAQGGQALSFWQYAPDYAYIEAIGGIKQCFQPRLRPQGQGPDIGAHEAGSLGAAGGSSSGGATSGNATGGAPTMSSGATSSGVAGSTNGSPPNLGDDEGCGCRITLPHSPRATLLLLAFSLALAVRRRLAAVASARSVP